MLSDLSFVDRRQRTARDFVLVFLGIAVLLLALLVVLVAWLQLRRLVNVLIGDIRGKRFLDDARSPRASQPILSQVRQVLAEVEEKQRLESTSARTGRRRRCGKSCANTCTPRR